MTPTQATENAAELIRKAEETAGDPARARVLLECADRWLALSVALENARG